MPALGTVNKKSFKTLVQKGFLNSKSIEGR